MTIPVTCTEKEFTEMVDWLHLHQYIDGSRSITSVGRTALSRRTAKSGWRVSLQIGADWTIETPIKPTVKEAGELLKPLLQFVEGKESVFPKEKECQNEQARTPRS